MKKLDGKIAIVTGATSGIGEACAKFLAREGAKVIITGRNDKRGTAVKSEISNEGGCAHFVKCDVTLDLDITCLKEFVEKEFGKLDILINNSGVFITSPLQQNKDSDWQTTFDVNVKGTYLMTKTFLSLLIESKGCILNNASIAGMQSYASGNSYMYSASKAAVIQFTKVLAKNYARNIRVNCICPGIIDTPIFTNRDMSRFNDRIPMGRVGTPEDVAKVALFLVSDDAAYITGAVVPIDGGVSL